MKPKKLSVAYVPSWCIYKDNRQSMITFEKYLSSLTHLIYCFLKIDKDSGKISLSDPWADIERPIASSLKSNFLDPTMDFQGNIAELVLLRVKMNPTLLYGFSIGGWNARLDFPSAIETPEKRAVFVTSCQEILSRFCFDFIDIDWEYPASKMESQNLLALLKCFKIAGVQVWMAMPAGPNSGKYFPTFEEMACYVEYFMIMTYDAAGPWSARSGHLAPFSFAKFSVKSYLKYGFPSHKVLLGIPLYGRIFHNCQCLGTSFSKCNGSEEASTLPLSTIQHMMPATCRRIVDSLEGGEYIITNDNHLISYESLQMALKKYKEIVLKYNLGGIFYWELSGDGCPQEEKSIIVTINRDLFDRGDL